MASGTKTSNTDTLRNQLAEQTQNPLQTGKTVQDEIRGLAPQIGSALPPGTLDKDRFVRLMLTEIRKTPQLLNCSRESLLGAMMTSAQLGLEPGGTLGQAYLVPYSQECTFQIGYKGWISLGARNGILLESREVREFDDFLFDFGTNQRLEHSWKLGKPRGEIIGYYGTAHFADGRRRFHVMDLGEIEERKARSKVNSNQGAWKTDPIAMSKKTVIRAMANQLPMSPEIGTAIERDDGIVRLRGEQMQVSFPDAIDAEVDQGKTEVTDLDTDAKRGTLTNMILAVEDPKLRKDAENYLLATFDSIPNIPADQLDHVIEEMDTWLNAPMDGYGSDGPQASETPPVGGHSQEAAPEPQEQPQEDWAESTPVESDEDVEKRILANITGMRVADLKTWMAFYELPVVGDVRTKRLDLLPLMVRDYKAGVPAIRDLF